LEHACLHIRGLLRFHLPEQWVKLLLKLHLREIEIKSI
jgi:hypothetical protein